MGSVVVAHELSCSAACGIFPDQGLNPCPLHWQADSQPLRHRGSPLLFLYPLFYSQSGILYLKEYPPLQTVLISSPTKSGFFPHPVTLSTKCEPQFSYLEGGNHHICWLTIQGSCEEVRWCRWKDFIISSKSHTNVNKVGSLLPPQRNAPCLFSKRLCYLFRIKRYIWGYPDLQDGAESFGEFHIDDKQPQAE